MVPSPSNDPAAPAPLLDAVLPIWRHHVEQARRQSEDSTAHLLTAFGAISSRLDAAVAALDVATAPALREACAAMQADIEQALVHFQAQDRFSQVLGCVAEDMDRLGAWLAQGGDPQADLAGPWLARLDASYTMEEQRSASHGGASISKAPAAIDFF